jgi:7,8-dihydropterin-6-yl-methyl-4-(beta-D-ribofuranosyl)aminobenzene 5'-phosphate synthase
MMRVAFHFVFAAALMYGAAGASEGDTMIPAENVTIRVVYDNMQPVAGFIADWGFSCVIEGCGKTILFDTGGRGELLMRNLASAGVDPSAVDIVVLSHQHLDHTGGLESFLDENGEVTVWAPASFTGGLKEAIAGACDSLVEVEGPAEIIPGVFTTGDMTGPVREQSLALRTSKGTIVVTGCAHPGIDRIVERAVEVAGGQPLLVMGGFHLRDAGRERLEEIAAVFDKAGVRYCGASHCTGDGSIAFFRERYGDRYIPLGAGAVVRGADLADK